VEDDILDGIVTRRADNVRTTNLDGIVFTKEICDLVETGTADTSPWVHDRALVDGADLTSPDELGEGLKLLKICLLRIRKERNKPKSTFQGLAAVAGDGRDPGSTPAPAAQLSVAAEPKPDSAEKKPADDEIGDAQNRRPA